MGNVDRFVRLVATSGSRAIYHREESGVDCPCLSPEGFRSPKWHATHPVEPVCNEEGKLDGVVVDLEVRAFVQPVQSGATRRLTSDYAMQIFGEVQQDDHLGIFPLAWSGIELDFSSWGQSGEDYILYNGNRYLVVNSNLIPDPENGEPHHFECGLRLIKNARAV